MVYKGSTRPYTNYSTLYSLGLKGNYNLYIVSIVVAYSLKLVDRVYEVNKVLRVLLYYQGLVVIWISY